jgi:hypothetical protein
MLTGDSPFKGSSAFEVISKANESLFAYESLAGVLRDRDRVPVADDMFDLLDRMTKQDRRQRFDSCHAVADRVDEILAARKNGGETDDGTIVAEQIEARIT